MTGEKVSVFNSKGQRLGLVLYRLALGSDGHKLFILSLTLTKFPTIVIKLLVKLF